jgi:hypothetical protein
MNLITLLLSGAYLYIAWKFWTGYRRTNFNTGLPGRAALTLLWPVLLALNPAYRQNFRKALKGRD